MRKHPTVSPATTASPFRRRSDVFAAEASTPDAEPSRGLGDARSTTMMQTRHEPARRCHISSTTLSPMAAITTPWGKASSLEEVRVRQRAGERQFTTRVELLESAAGERLVRFSYETDGTARRGPVTLRERGPRKAPCSARARPDSPPGASGRGAVSESWQPGCLRARARARPSDRVRRRSGPRGAELPRSGRAAGLPRAPGGASGRARCPPRSRHRRRGRAIR